MTRRHFDRDLMHMAAPSRVANVTLGTLNALQNWEPHEQVLGAAAVFLHLADFWRVPAQDVFTAVTNLINDKDGKARPEFRAIRPYLDNELGNK